jgi:hypothetical protein
LSVSKEGKKRREEEKRREEKRREEKRREEKRGTIDMKITKDVFGVTVSGFSRFSRL